MRPGLLMIGGGFITLGLLVVGLGLLNLPYTVTNRESVPVYTVLIPPSGSYLEQIVAPAGSSSNAAISVNTSATAPVLTYLLTCAPSPPQAPPSGCIAAQGKTTMSGMISLDPAPDFPYFVYVTSPTNTSIIHLDLKIFATSETITGLSLWQATVIMVAGGVLAAIGGVLGFLGLFLGGNPYLRRSTPPKEPGTEPARGATKGTPGKPTPGSEKAGEASGTPATEEEKALW